MFGCNLIEGGFDAWVNSLLVEEGGGYFLDATFYLFVEGQVDESSG